MPALVHPGNATYSSRICAIVKCPPQKFLLPGSHFSPTLTHPPKVPASPLSNFVVDSAFTLAALKQLCQFSVG